MQRSRSFLVVAALKPSRASRPPNDQARRCKVLRRAFVCRRAMAARRTRHRRLRPSTGRLTLLRRTTVGVREPRLHRVGQRASSSWWATPGNHKKRRRSQDDGKPDDKSRASDGQKAEPPRRRTAKASSGMHHSTPASRATSTKDHGGREGGHGQGPNSRSRAPDVLHMIAPTAPSSRTRRTAASGEPDGVGLDEEEALKPNRSSSPTSRRSTMATRRRRTASGRSRSPRT